MIICSRHVSSSSLGPMANLSPSRLRGTRAPRGRGDFDELCRWIAMQQATPAYTEDRQDDRSDVASTPQCQPATCRVGVSRPMALPIGHEARPISPSAASTLQFGRWHAGIKAANSCILMMSENESETSMLLFHQQQPSQSAARPDRGGASAMDGQNVDPSRVRARTHPPLRRGRAPQSPAAPPACLLLRGVPQCASRGIARAMRHARHHSACPRPRLGCAGRPWIRAGGSQVACAGVLPLPPRPSKSGQMP